MNRHEIDEIRKKAKKLNLALYPTIGEFVIAFEANCHSIRIGIGTLLQKNGLKSSNLVDILVGDLTIFPLQSIYRAIIVEMVKLSEKEKRIVDLIFKRVINLGEKRNQFIHAAWFIDFKNLEDLKNGLLVQYRPGYSKSGAKESPGKIPIEEIKKQINESRNIGELLEELHLCFYSGTKIEKRFKIDQNKNLIMLGSIRDFMKIHKDSPTGTCVPIKTTPL